MTTPKLTLAQAAAIQATADDGRLLKNGKRWSPGDVATKTVRKLGTLGLLAVDEQANPGRAELTDAGRRWLEDTAKAREKNGASPLSTGGPSPEQPDVESSTAASMQAGASEGERQKPEAPATESSTPAEPSFASCHRCGCDLNIDEAGWNSSGVTYCEGCYSLMEAEDGSPTNYAINAVAVGGCDWCDDDFLATEDCQECFTMCNQGSRFSIRLPVLPQRLPWPRHPDDMRGSARRNFRRYQIANTRAFVWQENALEMEYERDLLREKLTRLRSQKNAAESDLADAIRELRVLTESGDYEASMQQLVEVASVLRGRLVAQMHNALESGISTARKTGCLAFEAGVKLKGELELIPEESRHVVALESIPQVTVKASVPMEKAKGTVDLDRNGCIVTTMEARHALMPLLAGSK